MRSAGVAVAAVALGVGLTSCTTLVATHVAVGPPVSEVSGFTKVATTAHYIVVVNVLPAEEMFTRSDAERAHPIVGELVISGHPTPRRQSSRHTEAHVYSRRTGLPLTSPRPTITLVDHTSGRVQDVDATLMQDVVIGASDLHFGSNLVIPSGHDFTISVEVGGEAASVDGHLR